MRVHLGASAAAGAVVAIGLYAAGAVLDALLPWGAPALVSYVFHVDVIELSRPFTWDSFLIGSVLCGLAGAFIGTFVAGAYNVFASRLPEVSAVGRSRTIPAPR